MEISSTVYSLHHISVSILIVVIDLVSSWALTLFSKPLPPTPLQKWAHFLCQLTYLEIYDILLGLRV